MSSMAKLACTVWAIAALLAIHPHDVIAQCTLYTPNLSIGITDEVQFQTSWVDCVVSFPVCSCQMTQVLTFLFRTHASHWNQTPVVIQLWDDTDNKLLTSYTGSSIIVYLCVPSFGAFSAPN